MCAQSGVLDGGADAQYAGVRACRVEVDAPEMPLLDGSAAPWVEAILREGLAPLAASDDSIVAHGAAMPGGRADATQHTRGTRPPVTPGFRPVLGDLRVARS